MRDIWELVAELQLELEAALEEVRLAGADAVGAAADWIPQAVDTPAALEGATPEVDSGRVEMTPQAGDSPAAPEVATPKVDAGMVEMTPALNRRGRRAAAKAAAAGVVIIGSQLGCEEMIVDPLVAVAREAGLQLTLHWKQRVEALPGALPERQQCGATTSTSKVFEDERAEHEGFENERVVGNERDEHEVFENERV